LYAFFFLRASGFCLKYSDEFIKRGVGCFGGGIFWGTPVFY
jgi:hypothetical protein